MDLGEFQNKITDLQELELYRYENIFKVYKTGTKDFFYYNILKKIKIPNDINNNLYDTVNLPVAMPLTTLSYKIYGTTYLWWMIMITNDISNPAKIESGKTLKIIKRDFLKIVLESIKQQLQ
tara:strand:+ start:939 stop:1304 length:366 start_codon:yes stop_codon:yes gene_type:complete